MTHIHATMRFSGKQFFAFAAFFLMIAACTKNPVAAPVQPVNKLVTIDNIVFDTTTSRMLNTHPYGLDTQKQAYDLNGFGAFAGKTRTVKFSPGGLFEYVPVVKATGFSDYASTYLAIDTAGVIWEMYQQRFNNTEEAWSIPITVFASNTIQPAIRWNTGTGFEQKKNTIYSTFATKVINTNAVTSTGITGCIELEYSAPDYADTVYLKPGKGPVEVCSWRARLYENGQPAFGGYR